MNSHIALPKAAIHYRNVTVNGLEIFYREAGLQNAPVVLLLHGFPTSSHMFRDLIPMLAEHYHIFAPDYPGFGYSATPDVDDFDYTFDHLAEVMGKFTEALGLEHYALYMQDFGGPVGFRLAVRHPERITVLVVQNANAYEEGVTKALRDIVLRVWTDKSPDAIAAIRGLFELPQTQRQFLEGAEDPSLVSPDSWQHAQWGMERPGNKDIQYAIHADYGSNIERYDEWHRYFREHQPPVLVVWGKNDFVFAEAGATAYRQDLSTIEVHLLSAGHFALETKATEIAGHILGFLSTYAPARLEQTQT